MDDATCKGDIALGTACMKCRRCQEQMPAVLHAYKVALTSLRNAAVYCSAAFANDSLRDEAERKLKTALEDTRNLPRN